ncbi:hypothetical protein [Pseudoxanthomonas sp. 10H]|uniref:hypothetical protein n=1 Tax=Pseudoxanthomonas sp. 10H TaxID=3242729 RepID=UPI0035578F36
MHRLIATVAVVLALSGCAGASKVMVGQARPAIDPAQVRLYTVVPVGSQEIAQIEASSAIGFGTQGQTDSAVTRLKAEAAALGANGVVLMGVGSSGSSGGGVSVGGGSWGSSSYGGVGIGIPTQQRKAVGMAIWVPPGAVPTMPESGPAAAPATDALPAPATPTRPR